jgi:predicted short-subunit dehydrogenase-like oxidoreductase (DUF2520 family)
LNRIGLIGAGVVGSALATWLHDSGFEISAVASRRRAASEHLAKQVNSRAVRVGEVAKDCQLLFITTSDQAIAQVCEQVAAAGFGSCQAAFHLSGALSSQVLAPARQAGLGVASMHPIGSFADIEQARKLLPCSWFTVEGNIKGRELAEELLRKLGAKFRYLEPEQKALYHASAVFASNYLVSLLSVAEELWRELGLEPQEGLWGLAEGTLANIQRTGIAHSLTGPIRRGDLETVALHLKVLADKPGPLRLYRQLGLEALKLAGLGEKQEQSLALLLKGVDEP